MLQLECGVDSIDHVNKAKPTLTVIGMFELFVEYAISSMFKEKSLSPYYT